jgi:hypothetical protein
MSTMLDLRRPFVKFVQFCNKFDIAKENTTLSREIKNVMHFYHSIKKQEASNILLYTEHIKSFERHTWNMVKENTCDCSG